MKFNQLGDKIIPAFVVTVQEVPQKTDQVQAHFEQMGLAAENFNGISANESGLITEHTYEVDNPGSGYRIGRKPTATWMSFYMLWSALNLLDYEYFFTLEWDSKLHQDWKVRADKAMRDAPKDFDMLFLGSCCTKNAPKTHVKGDIYQVKWPMCGHGTIIAKKALPVLLSKMRKVYSPLDIALKDHAFPHLNVLTVLPRLIDQFDTFLVE